MTKAFEGHDLTEGEIHDLLIFLKGASKTENSMASGYLLYGIFLPGCHPYRYPCSDASTHSRTHPRAKAHDILQIT